MKELKTLFDPDWEVGDWYGGLEVIGVTPAGSPDWGLRRSGVPRWDSVTEYAVFALVEEASDIYRSISPNNVGNKPSESPTHWRPRDQDLQATPNPGRVPNLQGTGGAKALDMATPTGFAVAETSLNIVNEGFPTVAMRGGKFASDLEVISGSKSTGIVQTSSDFDFGVVARGFVNAGEGIRSVYVYEAIPAGTPIHLKQERAGYVLYGDKDHSFLGSESVVTLGDSAAEFAALGDFDPPFVSFSNEIEGKRPFEFNAKPRLTWISSQEFSWDVDLIVGDLIHVDVDPPPHPDIRVGAFKWEIVGGRRGESQSYITHQGFRCRITTGREWNIEAFHLGDVLFGDPAVDDIFAGTVKKTYTERFFEIDDPRQAVNRGAFPRLFDEMMKNAISHSTPPADDPRQVVYYQDHEDGLPDGFVFKDPASGDYYRP